MESQEQYLQHRSEKISRVQTSLQKIHRMYETLNEIVQEQGETLNKIEDNVVCTKVNTGKTVTELQKALANEKTIRDRLCGCDFGVMCLSLWFVVAMLFFLIDMSL
jgi:t-SNARE complex subunit (syntaxin)